MNLTEIQKFMKVVQRHSPNVFINPNFELIVEPKTWSSNDPRSIADELYLVADKIDKQESYKI